MTKCKDRDGAHVVFYRELRMNPEGKFVLAVLLCKRTQDAPNDPGLWSLFGGQLDDKDNGDPECAVRREIQEELKTIDVNLGTLEMEELDVASVRGCTVTYFKAHLNIGMNMMRLRWNMEHNKVEGEGIGWFTEKEVQELKEKMRQEDYAAITKFFESAK